MFLGESINAALEELWQLSLTLSSLKYISSMVRQELGTGSASTGHEEETIEGNESHRPSHVDRKEASSDEKEDIVKNINVESNICFPSAVSHSAGFKDTSNEPDENLFNTSMVAHYIYYTDEICIEQEKESLSMVCHQAELLYDVEKWGTMISGSNDCTQSVELETYEQETEIPFITSMGCHHLSSAAVPVEFPEFLVSMAAHLIIHDYENNAELGENASCIAHKVTNEETTVDQCSTFDINEFINGVTENNEKEKNEKLFKEHSDIIIMEENDQPIFIPSSVSHSVAFRDVSTEPDETNHKISMIVHCKYNRGEEWTEEGNEVLSMVCHKAKSTKNEYDYCVKNKDLTSATQVLENIKTEHVEPSIEQQFITSMTSHQLPSIGTPVEVSEIPISMAAHVMVKNYEHSSDPQEMNSLIVHHAAYVNEESGYHKIVIYEPISEETKVEIEFDFGMEFRKNNYVGNHFNEDVSIQLLPSMCTHILPSIATSIDEKVDHISLSVHRCTPYTEEDADSIGETGIINSMVAHQISVDEKISDVNMTEELADNNEFFVPTGEKENGKLPFHSSMVSHQLPQFEIPDELPEFMVSSVSHGCMSSIDQHDMFESDPGLLMTMIAHQKSIETDHVNNIGIHLNNYWEFYEPVNEVLISIEETETETYFLPSMYTHHLPTVDTPIEMSNNLATMAVHTTDQSWTANTIDDEPAFESDPGMITSMLSHHVTTENQCLHSSQEQELIEHLPQILDKSNDPKDIHFNDLPYFVSMVFHCIPYRDTPIEFGSCMVSAASHGLMLIEQQEDNVCPSTSMVAHLHNMDSYNQSPASSECFILDFVRDIIQNEDNSKETNHCDESSMYKTESGVYSGIQEDKSSTSDSSHTSMVAHQITASDIPNELLDYFTSSTAHRINGESQENKELIYDLSMLFHKISDITQEDIEYDQIINQTDFLNDNMEEEKDDYIPVNVCTQETYKEVNLPTNQDIQVESHIPFIETNKYVPNIEVAAEKVVTYDISSVVSKEAHIANNDLKQITKQLGNNEKGQDNLEHLSLSFEKENNICQDERPVELNEDLIVSASCDNFVSEEQNNENDIVINDFDSKLTNVRELHKIVEDEIGELENKRNNNSSANENNVKITETCIVSNVKGVEIQSCFTFHHVDELEDTEHLTSDSKEISLEANRETCFSTTEDNHSENKEEDEKVDTHSNASSSGMYNSRENLVHASCTIENNHPVIITACNLQLNSEDLQSQSTRNDINEGNAIDHAAEENGQIKDLNEETLNDNDYIFNDLKQHLRRTPRKSITSETKIRETQLMKSFLQASPKENIEFGEEKDCQKKSPKSSIIFSTLNANVKKHSYKIRFKVKVGAESSKSSVLQYLLGCFGEEKLIPVKK